MMRTSRFGSEVKLLDPPSPDISHICYNTLTGRVLGATEDVAEIMQRGHHEVIQPEDLAKLGEETVNYLVQQSWLRVDDEAPLIDTVSSDIRRALGFLGQYAVVPWPEQDAPFGPEHAMDVISALVEADERTHRHYHFYALNQNQQAALERAAETIRGHWHTPTMRNASERLLVLTLNPLLSVDWDAWSFLEAGEGRLRLPIHPGLIDEDGGLSWIDSITTIASEAAQVGFSTWIIIFVTPDDPPEWLDTALASLSRTGILYTCAFPFCFVAKRSVPDWREYLCELDNIDFALLEDILHQTPGSHRRSLAFPHGGGIVQKASALVSRRAALTPELFYCRAIPTGYYVNFNGEIWPCPKMAAGLGDEAGLRPLATYDTKGIYPIAEMLHKWRHRAVTKIEPCQGCVGMFNCAGGCALEAAIEHDGDPFYPACQPVERFMRSLIETHERHLTKRFGPEGGIQ